MGCTSREKAGGASLDMLSEIPPISETIVQLDQLDFFASVQSQLIIATRFELIYSQG